MNTKREELRGIISNTICNASNYPSSAIPHLLGRDMSEVLNKTTDALIAAGYRKPHTITTAEELDALPIEAVVMSETIAYQKYSGGDWSADGRWYQTVQVTLPATVLHEPTPGGAP